MPALVEIYARGDASNPDNSPVSAELKEVFYLA
jgi:L-rhamnose mutarotase